MSLFFIDHRVTYVKQVKAPLHSVLAFLHDPAALMQLNPLLISVSTDPQDPTKHTIVDSLVLPFGYRRQITYRATITLHDEGMLAESSAGAGTTTKSNYKARAVSEDLTEVEEEVHVNVPCPSHHSFCSCPSSEVSSRKRTTRLSTASPRSWRRLLGLEFEMNGLLVFFVLALFIIVLWMARRSSADPYGEFHLSLNRLPGDQPGAAPRTEWLNMGYWKDTDIFPEACEALALKLVKAAGCKSGGQVLDVGHGSGESLIMLLTHPSVPRPAKLTGITSLDAHHQRSKTRVARLNQTVPVSLYAGDAVYRPGRGAHAFDPPSEHFDTILALDCAYHFETRWVFLQQAHEQLKPGGSVALADICFAPGALQTRWTRCVTAVLRLMPRENMVSTDEYVARMRRIGYTDVRLEDITVDVFPGFIKFIRGQGMLFAAFGVIMGVFARAGARFVIVRGTGA
ncbi:S-adenosyl-L-methionine-dependent methyltransferase [Mycena galericulata]|nr:S-adenosyl-L-methionine-dependent methyltransferase [Mycena galericulata]